MCEIFLIFIARLIGTVIGIPIGFALFLFVLEPILNWLWDLKGGN